MVTLSAASWPDRGGSSAQPHGSFGAKDSSLSEQSQLFEVQKHLIAAVPAGQATAIRVPRRTSTLPEETVVTAEAPSVHVATA
jgi:hypothetical protein